MIDGNTFKLFFFLWTQKILQNNCPPNILGIYYSKGMHEAGALSSGFEQLHMEG